MTKNYFTDAGDLGTVLRHMMVVHMGNQHDACEYVAVSPAGIAAILKHFEECDHATALPPRPPQAPAPRDPTA